MTEWRELTAEEARSWPKAQLGGALLWIVIATGLLSLTLLLIFLMLGGSLVFYGGESAMRTLFSGGGERHVKIGLVSAVSVLFLLIGAVIVFTMTMLRASATPMVASVGAVLLFFVQIATNVAVQALVLEGNMNLVATAMLPMMPHWLGGIAATAGFVGYMIGGVRPNAYFRRRVSVPPS